MTKLQTLTKTFYLQVLASIGAVAAWFALMSTGSCSGWWIYQPKMPESLVEKDS